MRHRRRVKHFSRKSTALKALFRGLMVSIVEHGRIKTTVDKAKELRKHIEKAITLAKKSDLASRRLLLSRIPNKDTVETLMSDLAPRFKDRNGGYTRVIKIGRRPGDSTEMAFIEFVDHDWENKSENALVESTEKTKKKTAKTETKKSTKTLKKSASKEKASARA